MKYWLIVYVVTNFGTTQFSTEFESKARCDIALVKTFVLETRKEGDRNFRFKCSPYSTPEIADKRGIRT